MNVLVRYFWLNSSKVQQVPRCVACRGVKNRKVWVSTGTWCAIQIHEEDLPHPGTLSLATGVACSSCLGQGPWQASGCRRELRQAPWQGVGNTNWCCGLKWLRHGEGSFHVELQCCCFALKADSKEKPECSDSRTTVRPAQTGARVSDWRHPHSITNPQEMLGFNEFN